MYNINLDTKNNSCCCSDTVPNNNLLISKVNTHNGLNFHYVLFDNLELYKTAEIGSYILVQIDENSVDYCLIERKKIKSCELNLLQDTNKLPKVIKIADDNEKQKILTLENEYKKYEQIFKTKVKNHNLDMKFIATHMQYDKHRLFFYYTAEGRVDFRSLAKDLASEFKTRIELRQISYREETRIKGGIGTCGRELCCSTFLDTLKRIPTQIAFDQNITFNVSKISGVCGKLKCCLLYEFDEEKYQEILKSNNFQQALQENGLKLNDDNI
jgi:cell fate regulator YaaT (PSP1 superfamily)